MEILTTNATHDDLTDEDYRDLYHELRGYDPDSKNFVLSLRGFADFLGSAMSHAVWAKYDKSEAQLTRRMKNELRSKAGVPLLPPTVDEAMSVVSEDASVYRLESEGQPDQVVMGHSSDPRWRGLFSRPQSVVSKPRKKVIRPVVDEATNVRREALGVEWKDVIRAGLDALESSPTP